MSEGSLLRKIILIFLLIFTLSSVSMSVLGKGRIRVFSATAYCGIGKGCAYGVNNKRKGKTASGVVVRRGVVAADPRVLPLKSYIRVISPKQYAGIYLVADTGGAIKGNILDFWVPTLKEALTFGRKRNVIIEILDKEEVNQTIFGLSGRMLAAK